MERGYLVAVLAIIATFTGLSHGLRSLDHWWLIRVQRTNQVATRPECHASTAARALAKINAHLRPHYAEEAQLLAEMNMPVIDVPSDAGENNITRCARARAMAEAEHARRDMLQMQRDMGRAAQQLQMTPLSLQISLPPDFEKQIAQSSAIAARIAATQVRARIGCELGRHQPGKPPTPEE